MTPGYIELREKESKRLETQLSALPEGDYILELGCGHGHFLSAMASREKECNHGHYCVGVDKKRDRLEKAKKKSDRALVDVFWIRGGVEDVLKQWPSKREVTDCFVLFPDPWPKKKHWKHRFVNEVFLGDLAKISQKGGKLYFRTDHKGYFDAVKELLVGRSDWKIDSTLQWPGPLPSTVFEGHHPEYESLIAVLTSQCKIG